MTENAMIANLKEDLNEIVFWLSKVDEPINYAGLDGIPVDVVGMAYGVAKRAQEKLNARD